MSEGRKQTTGRFMALEGVRGIAAVMVVFSHLAYMFWQSAVTGHGIQHYRLEDNFYGTPLYVLVSGSFAVSIFFVLSGFVLSIGFFIKGDERSVKSQLSRRYLRLMIPAAAACTLAWMVMFTGAHLNQNVSQLTGLTWLGEQWNFIPNFMDALYNGFLGIFLSSSSQYTMYDPVLWTMHLEFFGSLMIFSFLLLIGKNSKRWIGYCLLILLLYKTQYLGFLLGMMVADLYAQGRLRSVSVWTALPALLLALYLGGVPSRISDGNAFYSFLPKIEDVSDGQWVWLLRTVAAFIVILIVLVTPRISNILEKPRISILGRYTFALYLTHIMVLFTVTSGLFILFSNTLHYNYAALLAFCASIPVIIGLTVVFEKYVDQPSIVLARRFSDWFMSEDSESLVQTFHRQRYALASKLYAIEAKYRYAAESAE